MNHCSKCIPWNTFRLRTSHLSEKIHRVKTNPVCENCSWEGDQMVAHVALRTGDRKWADRFPPGNMHFKTTNWSCGPHCSWSIRSWQLGCIYPQWFNKAENVMVVQYQWTSRRSSTSLKVFQTSCESSTAGAIIHGVQDFFHFSNLNVLV